MALYNATYGQNSKVVLALVVPAFLYIPVIILGLEYLPDMNGMNSLLITAFYLLCMAGTVYYLMKVINQPVIVELENDLMKVIFKNKGIFSPEDFKIEISQIQNFSELEDKGSAFMYFTTTGKPGSFFLSAKENDSAAMTDFNSLKTVLQRNIAKAVKNKQATISSRTMYEQTWAKALAAVMIIVILAGPIAIFNLGTGSLEQWIKYALMVFAGGAFIYQVYYHNYIKNKN